MCSNGHYQQVPLKRGGAGATAVCAAHPRLLVVDGRFEGMIRAYIIFDDKGLIQIGVLVGFTLPKE